MESEKDKEVVGASDYEIFTLKAISKGRTDITLDYKRPWEENEEPAETFKITITVK